MGRRPNPLILEHFERGPKLEDASNRYQHTCKSCGEKFPKGRADSLMNHLIKRCPALPLHERQRAQQQQHDFSDLNNLHNLSRSVHAPLQNGQTTSLPYAPSKEGLSALETLAEVSRRHLDMSDKRTSKQHQQHDGNHHDFEFLVDDRPDEDMNTLSQSLDVSGVPALPSIYQFNGPLQHSPTDSPHIEPPHMSNLPLVTSGGMAQMVPSLVMAASQANDLMPLHGALAMEPHLSMPNPGSASDKFFQAQGRQWTGSLDSLIPDHCDKDMPELLQNDVGSKPASPLPPHPRPIAMNPHTHAHFTTDFSMNPRPQKPKVRGRFTDSRRKEVQEVRKRGACIRCRMLKKPCSGDTPCNTCQNVESARLWKQPCIRTRIAEEFNLYSAGLHGVLGFHAVNQAKNQIRLDQMVGRVEATLFPEACIYATFTPLRCPSQPHEIDPAILASLSPSQLEIIDSDDNITAKLELYMAKVGDCFRESESSAFMKATVDTALEIISTPTSQDSLLTKALELWNLTRILTSPEMRWHFFSNPSLSPSMEPAVLSPSSLETINRTCITPISNHNSYELIKVQLKGATEKRAALLARTLMNEVERRLLQRQQANPFETFLMAVILLACVERMCWLFCTWEQGQPPPTFDHAQPLGQSQPPTSEGDIAQALQPLPPPAESLQHTLAHHPRWPFDRHPSYYSQQGERFSDILLMLLKMRSVPPKPKARDGDGMLYIPGSGPDIDERVCEWYEKISVTVEVLAERANAEFVGENPREWELKYVGKIISGL